MHAVPRNPDVEQDRRRHDRHRHRPGPVPDVALRQEPDHPRRRIEPERAPAAQDYGMDLRDVAGRPQQVGLAGAGSGAANVHAPNGATPAQHNRAPGTASQVSSMPHLDAGHICYAAAATQQQTSPLASWRTTPWPTAATMISVTARECALAHSIPTNRLRPCIITATSALAGG